MSDLHNLRIAAYARYSSALQSDSSIDDQFRLLREHLSRLDVPWSQVDCFQDAATSGASLNRTGFNTLRARLFKTSPDYDVLLVESVDRLSRDMADSSTLLKELNFAGVRLIAASDGIDTANPNARLSYGFRAVMNEQYLVDLGHKTSRGLRARAEKGLATGGVPFGYRTKKNLDEQGKSLGSDIHIHDEEAKLVNRIFKLWIDGNSCSGIAGLLNAEEVPSPRSTKKRNKRGWPGSTIRGILRNTAYIGKWTYGEHKWTKDPTTGKRRRRKARPEEVQKISQPLLRIIDEQTWGDAQKRIQDVGSKYQKAKGKAPNRKSNYPLSGLLVCDKCGATMVIVGGSSCRYYKCGDFHKRKNCSMSQGLREDQISHAVVGVIQKRLRSPQAIAFLADQLSKVAAKAEGNASVEYRATEKALDDTSARLGRLIENLATGTLSALAAGPINQALEKEEASRLALEAKLKNLDDQMSAKKSVPSKKELTKRAKAVLDDLEAQLRKNPIKAREQIRQFIPGGKITMQAQHDGSWAAKFDYYPTLLLEKRTNGNSPRPKSEAVYSLSCAGRI